MTSRWQNVLPKPIAFVLSGGAALGAIQVGMLKALRDVGLYPDLIVGTSAGALNGSVIADFGLDEGVDRLDTMWQYLSREDIFPGGRIAQARHLLSHRTSLVPNDRLVELGCRMLKATKYEALQLPFGVLATELLTNHGALFTTGDLHRTLLASSAIPGVFPPVEINGVLYVDGALTAYVPMAAAVRMGAGSLVVLDAGGACHRERPPHHVAEMFLATMNAAFRQRVRVEAVKIANERPILYLPTLCSASKALLDFSHSQEFMDQAFSTVRTFLTDAPVPEPGSMCGAPHHHDNAPVHSLTRYAEG
jgi:NTE family protein